MNKYTASVVCGVLVTVTGFAIWSVAQAHPLVGRSPGDVPDKLAGFSALVHFTPAEVQALKTGQPVSKHVESDDREVRVFGAVWINAPVSKYMEAINHIERLEQGDGFQITRRISDPPRLEDFADLQLPEGDVQELKKCRPGKCDVKLDE
jgi:hypothetical protein